MTPPDPPAITFLDDEGEEHDEIGTSGGEPGSGSARPVGTRVGHWWPDGGGAAIASLVFTLVAWLGSGALVTAVTALFPEGTHRVGPLTEQSVDFGTTTYNGVTPGLIPVISFGVRAAIAVIALVLGWRARRAEHSPLATAAASTAAISVALFVLGGVALEIGFAHGHGANAFGTF